MKRIALKVIGVLVIAVVLMQSLVMAATNETVEKNNDKIDELKEQKSDVQEEKSTTQEQVEDLNTQISDYQSQINELDTKISDLNTKIEETQKKLEEAQAKYDENKKLAEERLVIMQESGDTSYLDFILSSDSVTDLISSYYLASELAQADTELLDGLEAERQEVENAKTELENSKVELANSRTAKESVSAQLEVARNEKSQKVTDLTEEEQDLQEEIDQLEKDNQQILNEIRIAQEKYKAQLEALKNQANNSSSSGNGSNSSNSGGHSGGTTTGSGSGIFIVPIKSYSYISTNGYYSSGKFHGAIDYATSSGTPVYAAADGVVMTTKDLTTSYGTYVVIQHANGLQTWYGHGTRGSICVSPGQTVKQGQQIMSSGSTGNSSGPHLHFEVRKSPYNYSYSAKKYGDDSRANPNNYF